LPANTETFRHGNIDVNNGQIRLLSLNTTIRERSNLFASAGPPAAILLQRTKESGLTALPQGNIARLHANRWKRTIAQA
jgi:hypothetical protein